MKNSASVLTKITLGLAMAGCVFACKNNSETKTAAAVPVDAKATTVFVNQDTLLSKYEYVKDMTKRLTDKGTAAQNDVAAKQQAFQREYTQAQQSAATMTPDQQKATGERLQKEQQSFQQYQQNASAEMQQVQLSEQTKLYDKISDFMKAYAKEKGYKMILTYQHGSATLLYGDASLDVTADVVKRLNDAYSKEKK